MQDIQQKFWDWFWKLPDSKIQTVLSGKTVNIGVHLQNGPQGINQAPHTLYGRRISWPYTLTPNDGGCNNKSFSTGSAVTGFDFGIINTADCNWKNSGMHITSYSNSSCQPLDSTNNRVCFVRYNRTNIFLPYYARKINRSYRGGSKGGGGRNNCTFTKIDIMPACDATITANPVIDSSFRGLINEFFNTDASNTYKLDCCSKSNQLSSGSAYVCDASDFHIAGSGPTQACDNFMNSYCTGGNLNTPVCGCYSNAPHDSTTHTGKIFDYFNKSSDQLIPKECLLPECKNLQAYKNQRQFNNRNCPQFCGIIQDINVGDWGKLGIEPQHLEVQCGNGSVSPTNIPCKATDIQTTGGTSNCEDKIVNGYIQPMTACSFTPNSGYGACNPVTVTCKPDGKWSNIPTCQTNKCDLLEIEGATTDCSGKAVDGKISTETVCTYTQKAGYDNCTPSKITCNLDGTWSNTPSCKQSTCALLEVDGATTDCSKEAVDGKINTGTTCLYTPRVGYEHCSPQQITCGTDGSWNATPVCLKTPDPPKPDPPKPDPPKPDPPKPVYCTLPLVEGATTTCGTSVGIGTTCTFEPIQGFKMCSPNKITCQSDGSWDSSVECTKDDTINDDTKIDVKKGVVIIGIISLSTVIIIAVFMWMTRNKKK